ncbi:MAG: hypothetical protein ACK5NY_00640 [Burkholderiaceae bacterium]
MMPFPWQHPTWQRLTAQAEPDGAALLLYGPAGHGKHLLARAYAGWLLCEAQPRPSLACGVCAGCRLFAATQHLDYRELAPEALIETADGGGPRTKPSQEIRIDDIRGLQAFSGTTAHRGGWKVSVIWPAQALNTNAANALLKTLEEPHHRQKYILVTSAVNQLIPTIRSRCRLICVPGASKSQAERWLSEQSMSDVDMVLALAGGAPLNAVAFADNEDAGLQRGLLDILSAPETIDVWREAQRFESLGVATIVRLAQRLLYDVLSFRWQRPLMHFDWLAPRLGWAKRIDAQDTLRLQQRLISAQRSAGHPLNPRLVVESLLQDWQDELCVHAH